MTVVPAPQPTLLEAQQQLLTLTLADERAREVLRKACEGTSRSREQAARLRVYETQLAREDAARAFLEARRNRDADLAAAWDDGVTALLEWIRSTLPETVLDGLPELRNMGGLTNNPHRAE